MIFCENNREYSAVVTQHRLFCAEVSTVSSSFSSHTHTLLLRAFVINLITSIRSGLCRKYKHIPECFPEQDCESVLHFVNSRHHMSFTQDCERIKNEFPHTSFCSTSLKLTITNDFTCKTACACQLKRSSSFLGSDSDHRGS